MAFKFSSIAQFLQGIVIIGQADDIPDTALRMARNVRLDRPINTVSSRVGMSRKTATSLTGILQYISKLFGNNNTDYSYSQTPTGTLTRYDNNWTAPGTVLSNAAGTGPLTDATMPDGATVPVPHKYFAGTAGPVGKDNGTVFSPWGIAPPTAAPLSIALAPDLTTAISTCDNAAAWTGTNLTTGPTNDAAILQEGAGSVTFSIAASTLGSLAFGPVPTANLDTLAGGDSLVNNDDYIHVWVRLDRPERLEYMQLDVDLDTSVVGNAFRNNFYSVVVSTARFSIGADAWNDIQMRKSEFQRYGTDGTKSWATAQAFRLRFLTNTLGTLTVWVDDIKLRGGIDLEGPVDYTVCNRNSTTRGLSNPPKDANGATLWTSKLTTNRQRITVDLSNVQTPSDTQVDTLWLFRRDVNFPAGIRVTESATGLGSYTDTNSDAVLTLSPLTLEVDNDVPPTGDVVVYGPGASNRLFAIVNGYRLRFSKQWEHNYNRAENWPLDNDAGIGDGSQVALAGELTDTQHIVWSEARTYYVVGTGAANFLPVLIPNSRGIVGKFAHTSGDGRVFFVSQDGVYEQIGLVQHKISTFLDPFFEGRAIDGNPALNISAVALATIRLQFHPDVLNPMLVMLYAAVGSATPNKRLVIKRGSLSGKTGEVIYGAYGVNYTDFLFDDSTQIMRSLFLDVEDLDLLAGAEDGHVYKLEDHAATTDDGTLIPWAWQGKSHNEGDGQKKKRYSNAVVEGTTQGAAVAVTATYNKNTVSEALGNIASTTIATQSLLSVGNALAEYQDIALGFVGTAPASGSCIISYLGWYSAMIGQAQTFWDSDKITMAQIQRLDRFEVDLLATAAITIRIYTDDTLQITDTIAPTTVRQRVTYVLQTVVRGRVFRVTLSSATAFEIYSVDAGEMLKFAAPALLGTFWDSDPLTASSVQRVDRLEFDLNAPVALTMTVSVDGTAQTPITLSPTTGRQRVTFVLTTPLRGRVFRVTLVSTSTFELFNPQAGDIFKFVAPALTGTFWDSDNHALPTAQRLDRLELDANAPAALSLSIFADGFSQETTTLPATSGRQRVSYPLTTTVRGRVFRVTLQSASAFEMFTTDIMKFMAPALVGPRWDSDYMSSPFSLYFKWLDTDYITSVPITAQIYLDNVLRHTTTLLITNGRQRLRTYLPATLRGKEVRIVLQASTTFQLFGLWDWSKPVGSAVGYAARPLYQAAA